MAIASLVPSNGRVLYSDTPPVLGVCVGAKPCGGVGALGAGWLGAGALGAGSVSVSSALAAAAPFARRSIKKQT